MPSKVAGLFIQEAYYTIQEKAPYFTAVIKFRRRISSGNLLVEKCLGIDSSERPRSRRDNNIQMDLSEFYCKDQRLTETVHDPVA